MPMIQVMFKKQKCLVLAAGSPRDPVKKKPFPETDIFNTSKGNPVSSKPEKPPCEEYQPIMGVIQVSYGVAQPFDALARNTPDSE